MGEVYDIEAVPLNLGKKSRYTAAQDLVIAREVGAARAHTPPYGETRKRFEEAATKFNANSAFAGEPIGWKPLQDRYKRMQEQYCKLEDGNKRLSGVGGGEMGELADLLMTMREAKDYYDSQKKAMKTAERKNEEDKERMGATLMSAATKHKTASDAGSSGSSVNGESSDPENDKGSRSRKRAKKGSRGPPVVGSEMDRFGTHLKEADLARVDLERKRLVFEQERAVADRIEREKEREEGREEHRLEREERREERLEHSKLELEKHKALLELLAKHK